uniref:Uncharacterized protein n=1 Tax=Lotus japonicus TaxID=34305 RepID=I3SLU8_LOTJA|nr:unknown [Lotus japonicus]
MEQQAVSSFWARQSIPSQTSEQGRASCTPWVLLYEEGSMGTLWFQNLASTRLQHIHQSASQAQEPVN